MRRRGAKNATSSSRRCASAGSAAEDREQPAARAARCSAEAREQQGVGRTGRSRQREALAGGDVGEKHGAEMRRRARRKATILGGRDTAPRNLRLILAPRRNAIRRPAPMSTIARTAVASTRSSPARAAASAPAPRCPSSTSSIAGRPLVAHTLAALVAVPRSSRILVVVAPDDGHFESLVGLPPDPRLVVRALRRRDARRDRRRRPRQARRARRGADTTGCSSTTRRVASFAPSWVDALDRGVPRRRHRRPAGAPGRRHAQARRGRIARSRRWRATTSGRRRRRRCSASACSPMR